MLALGFVVFACASDDGMQAITDQQYDDLARHIGATTANPSGGEVGSMQDAIDLSIGVLPRGISATGTGHFGGARAGVTFDYAITCQDVRGNPLPACGAYTDRADVQVTWAGALTLPALSADVSRHGHWVLANLTTDQPRLGGDGSFTFDSQIRSTAYHLAYTAHYDDVVFEAHVPVSGQIHYAIDASGPEGMFDVDAVITFTGDGHASLVLDGDRTYLIDLATGVVIKVGASASARS
jgi:hypothetical protein